MKIRLNSAPTLRLKQMFGRGECDAILTTEDQAGPGGEVLVRLPLVWIGATDGNAWRESPLPVAFCSNCIFRSGVLRRMDAAGQAWDMAVESDLDNAVEAVVSADLAVTAGIDGFLPRQCAPVDHGGALPDLGETRIILYMEKSEDPVKQAVRDVIRSTYCTTARGGAKVRLTA